MKLPTITLASNGFWYADVPNTTNQVWLVSTKNGIEEQIPAVLKFCGSSKNAVIERLFDYFDSIPKQ